MTPRAVVHFTTHDLALDPRELHNCMRHDMCTTTIPSDRTLKTRYPHTSCESPHSGGVNPDKHGGTSPQKLQNRCTASASITPTNRLACHRGNWAVAYCRCGSS